MQKVNSIILFVFLLFCGCAPEDDNLPVEVLIDNVLFSDQRLGINDHQEIVDVWAYEEDGVTKKLIGPYPLPARIPVKPFGTKLICRAGIISDGVRSLRVNHTQFKEDTLIITAKPGETMRHTPVFTYHSRLEPESFRDDFENGGSSLEATFADGGLFTVSQNPDLLLDSITNSRFGFIQASSDNEDISFITKSNFAVRFNTPVFLELHYRSTIDFAVGVQAQLENGSNESRFELVLRPKDTWQKIYVGLTEEVNEFIAFPTTRFRVSFIPVGDVKQGAYFAVDNLRLVYLN